MSSGEQKTTSPCAINDLADEDLTNIFKHLPPYDRLLISEVSKRWYGISRIPWRDVYHLDLSLILDENIGAIVKQTPNLRTVFAKDKQFALNQLKVLSRANLSSLTVYKSSAAIPEPNENDESVAVFSAVFSDSLPHATWKDMVLGDFNIVLGSDTYNRYVLGHLPESLERLQLTGFDLQLPQGDFFADLSDDGGLLLVCLGRLRHLTCLSLCPSPVHFDEEDASLYSLNIFHDLRALTHLRELCVSCDGSSLDFETLTLDLQELKVLFVNDVFFDPDDAGLENVTTKHPALRILCITGTFLAECTVPARRRFPNGFGSDPVPKLHVFVGKKPSEKIIFTKSPADALEIHPITEPLPAFLEKAEVAHLFEGVWIAAQIKESAKHGSDWWKYEGDTATSFRTADDA